MDNPAYNYSRRENRVDYNRVDMLLREPDGTRFSYTIQEGFLEISERIHSIEIRKRHGMTDIVLTEGVRYSSNGDIHERMNHLYSFDKNNHLVGIDLTDGDQRAVYSNKNHRPCNAFSAQSPEMEHVNAALVEPKLANRAMQDITKAFDDQLVRMGERGNEYIKKIDGVLTGRSR
jgi:hypothetical protein